MKIAAIVQARMTSNRLPGKVLMDLAGKPALQRVVERLKESKYIDDVIVACTTNKEDDPIIDLCKELGCLYFRGNEENVLDRVLKAAKHHNVDVIVEITADCPLVDWNHVNTLVELYQNGDYDFVSNIEERTFPRGYDIRIFSRDALKRVNKEIDNDIDRQHVATWMYLNPKGKKNYKRANLEAPIGQNRQDIEVTLDTKEDYELLQKIFAMGEDYKLELTCQDVINLIDTYPHIYQDVKKIERKNYFQELKNAYKQKEREDNNEKPKKRGKSKKKV